MANFCGKCGNPLHAESGLCPNCDAEMLKIYESTPSFCVVCGGAIDRFTGRCPECDRRAMAYNEYVAPTPKKNNVLTTIFSCLLAVLFVCFLVTTAVLGVVREAVSSESVDTLVDAIDWSSVVESASSKDKTDLYQYINRVLYIKIDDDVLEEFLEEPASKEFILSKFEQIIDGVCDERDVTIKTEEIADLLVDNNAFFKKQFKVTISQPIAQKIAEFMMYSGEPVIEVSDVKDDFPIVYWLLYFATSNVIMITLLAALAILAIDLFLNSASQGALVLGIIGTVFGALFTILMALSHTSLLSSALPTEVDASVVPSILGGFWMPSLILLGVGVLALVVRYLCIKIVRKNQG